MRAEATECGLWDTHIESSKTLPNMPIQNNFTLGYEDNSRKWTIKTYRIRKSNNKINEWKPPWHSLISRQTRNKAMITKKKKTHFSCPKNNGKYNKEKLDREDSSDNSHL